MTNTPEERQQTVVVDGLRLALTEWGPADGLAAARTRIAPRDGWPSIWAITYDDQPEAFQDALRGFLEKQP